MKIAVIGFGLRMRTVLAQLQKQDEDAVITAIYDQFPARCKQALEGEYAHLRTDGLVFYSSVESMLCQARFDAVFIGTRCDTHTPYAVKAMEAGVPVFLEKPVGINMEQLNRLNEARLKYHPNVMVSFPLRVTPLVMLAKQLMEAGEIGVITQIQAYNNVPYGRVYYKSWYRDSSITGGLWLQKATHDFDYLSYLAGKAPVKISAMSAKQVFKGEHPAGVPCPDCPEYKTCPESAWVIKNRLHADPQGDGCSFAVDTGNQDSGSAMIRFEDGIHAVYSQNFVARRNAGLRGARFIGYKGTLELEWHNENNVKIHRHFESRTDTYQYTAESGHFGGDEVLCSDFMKMVYEKAPSTATLEDGILSAALCLAAKKSCETDRFIDVPTLASLTL